MFSIVSPSMDILMKRYLLFFPVGFLLLLLLMMDNKNLIWWSSGWSRYHFRANFDLGCVARRCCICRQCCWCTACPNCYCFHHLRHYAMQSAIHSVVVRHEDEDADGDASCALFHDDAFVLAAFGVRHSGVCRRCCCRHHRRHRNVVAPWNTVLLVRQQNTSLKWRLFSKCQLQLAYHFGDGRVMICHFCDKRENRIIVRLFYFDTKKAYLSQCSMRICVEFVECIDWNRGHREWCQ